jgi:hypothetical protein
VAGIHTVNPPLHPNARHKHSLVGAGVYRGWDSEGRRWKVHVCKCGVEFFFEPD